MKWSVATLGILLFIGCKSDAKETAIPDTEPLPAAQDAPAPPLVEGNAPPFFELPAYSAVGVGQEIGFGLEVVDQEQDEVRVELLSKPASANYDPITLTVVWKPTREDMPQGHFKAKLTETRPSGETRVFTHEFSIAVLPTTQVLPSASPLGPAVETLITIHGKQRLAAVNKAWPFDKMLLRAAEEAWAKSPAAESAKVAAPTADSAYRAFLGQLALANDNDAVNPQSSTFDKASFGNAGDWEIIAIRPRLDKKWNELRIVYKAKAHAATYAMFKFRPTTASDLPPEAREYNNKVFAEMAFDAFFTKTGDLDPTLFADPKAHSKRVLQFVTAVLDHKGKEPWAKGTFLGLPCEARLGGGSKRNPDGTYASGDGWAWNNVKFKAKDKNVIAYNEPIKGFATAVEKSADGTSWEMVCAKRFKNDKAVAGLCRDSGHVDLPATGDGYTDGEGTSGAIVSAKKDAANMFRGFKSKDMVEELSLRDPRRDLFEEKGMTCSQCHVRRFGVRDFYDEAATNPRAGTPKALNKSQATTFFVLAPTVSWQPYALDFQHKQECKFKVAIETHTGVKTSLACPLQAQ